MGSEQIHYEALRKQMIIDRRNLLDIQKKHYQPKFQSHYVTYELPQDDMYQAQEPSIQANPTIHQFVPVRHNSDKSWEFVSTKDIHGNSSAAHRTDNATYSAKIKDRYNNVNYFQQW